MAYSWLLWGLASALSLATADALMKRFFAHLTPYGMMLVRLGYAVPILSLGWLWTPRPALGPAFFPAVAAALPLEVAASLLYMRALKTAPLSLCAPMMAFTPLFLILTGWLLLGEALHFWGIVGIVALALGSYLINLPEQGRGWLAPWTALWRLPGPRWMLMAAGLYAVTSALGKLAVTQSAPTFFGLFYPTAFSAVMLAGYPLSARPGRQILQRPGCGLLLGACLAVSILCHYHGIQQAPAAYLIAVKRTSLLFSVLYGGLWLGEEHLGSRALGAAAMVVGVILISLWG
ncbi:MAG: EamA family transporter [Desulfobacca sp.]|uniref:EamA family transporter n=1 Tax=Desulfobacca sp. TaxID=2067990 RepID=UPI00404B338C